MTTVDVPYLNFGAKEKGREANLVPKTANLVNLLSGKSLASLPALFHELLVSDLFAFACVKDGFSPKSSIFRNAPDGFFRNF
jgi:hypothetical protein